MSEHFHAHGPESHAVEHLAHHGVSLAQWVAILSAIFSCLAAFISYQSTTKQNQAILLKDEAIIKTTQASDMWAYLQSKKTKIHLMEIAITASTDSKKIANFQKEMNRYKADVPGIQANAEKITQSAKEIDEQGDRIMEPHEKLAQAMMMLQIAISLASITALTKKRWLLIVSLVSAFIGIGFAIAGWIL